MKGKSKSILNSKRVAIQVASELCRIQGVVEPGSDEENSLLDVLKKAVYDKSPEIRNTAYENIYYLSLYNPGEALKIVKGISGNWQLSKFVNSAMASATISLLMYCETFKASIEGEAAAQETIACLHSV